MKNRKIKINFKDANMIKDFVKTVERYNSDVDIITGRTVIDAKSIIGIFALDLSDDIYVQIISGDVAECRKFEAEMEEFK